MSLNKSTTIDAASIPESEKERIEELKSFNILNTLPEEEFDALTGLAARLCDVPISLINFIDTREQFTKSCVGISVERTPREQSICQYTILADEMFEINDLSEDKRFTNKSYVQGDPHLRYYAGVPLKSSGGYTIGSLCIMDYEPSKLTERQRKDLKVLADEVMARLKLRKRENRLEKINAYKDRLMRVVSHDIRSPLSGILGAAEFLNESDLEDQDKTELADLITESARQIQNIVNELLDAELVQFGKLKYNPDPHDISSIIKEITSLFKFMARNKKIELQSTIEEDIPDLLIDKHLYKRIISNLLSNAIKFTPKGGEVAIEGYYKSDSQTLVTTVRDEGIGMSEDQLENLFREKEEGGRPGTENESSYGLGMVIVKKLCSVCDAKIEVESEVNRGTEFKVEIPAKAAEMEMSDYRTAAGH